MVLFYGRESSWTPESGFMGIRREDVQDFWGKFKDMPSMALATEKEETRCGSRIDPTQPVKR